MEYVYNTVGTCAKQISFEIVDNKLHNVKFLNGCPGNLRAMELLLEGKDISEVSTMLKGVTCGMKSTSCSDQLVKGIEEAIANSNK